MKKAFTLIELLIVIVFVGVLTAIALSKLYNLKENSEISKDVRVSISIQLALHAQNLVPSVYVNLVDLEEKYDADDVTLEDLVTIDGENWFVSENGNIITYNDINMELKDNEIIALELHRDRRVTLRIDCDKYVNIEYQKKCKALAPDKISTLTF